MAMPSAYLEPLALACSQTCAVDGCAFRISGSYEETMKKLRLHILIDHEKGTQQA